MSLAHLFWLILSGLALLLTLHLLLFVEGSGRAIMKSASSLELGAARRAAALVEDYLYQARRTITDVSRQLNIGTCRADSPQLLEPCLVARLLENPNLTEIALTHANGRWQLSVFREQADEKSPICARLTSRQAGGPFVADTRCWPSGARLDETPETQARSTAADPTAHPTFTTPASQAFRGRIVSAVDHRQRLRARPRAVFRERFRSRGGDCRRAHR